ncbi:hypothetical protein NMY22_g15115 [Coprinellus aureogranulatus]|nr:hypothetical protein NMY22_g15115 [Coprinellus aureogranulatus]
MMSGTTIKAIVSYVTDYITKPTLKTHQIFSSAYDIYQKNVQLIGAVDKRKDAARLLLLKLANNLTSKLEIGSPMAAMYLLGHPDHYKSHQFVPFWWRTFVNRIRRETAPLFGGTVEDERVVLLKEKDGVIGHSNVDDYVYRPEELTGLSLYEFIQCTEKKKMRRKAKPKEKGSADHKDTPVVDGDVAEGDEDGEEDEEPDGSPELPDEDSGYHVPKKALRFVSGHSQSKSHYLTYHKERVDTHIPNFIGGTLPRKDSGDVEQYYLTMLTLFKPWRAYRDLLNNHTSWKNSFDGYAFSPKHIRYMKNFNLKYECLDERDDYHAVLKQKAKEIRSATFGSGRWTEEDHALTEEYNELLEELSAKVGDIDDPFLGLKGTRAIARDRHMESAELVARRSGWMSDLKESVKAVKEKWVKTSEKVSYGLRSAHWKTTVTELKKALIKKKQESMAQTAVKENKKRDLSTTDSVDVVGEDGTGSVEIVGKAYLRRNFKAREKKDMKIMDAVVKQFSLNKEQERAFRIIAQHACSDDPEQLKMHLGGMGGTGKSQVIKALIAMFKKRKETHRFVVLAPTGTAAALLGGSTYHSFLGIREENGTRNGKEFTAVSNETTVAEARERLMGVEYIFIDEVSMVSCQNLYSISAKLAEIKNFTPTFGTNLYDTKIETKIYGNMGQYAIYGILGKLLWHEVTVVVILVQNMRQKTQTKEDKSLRDMLVNMRYAECTQENLAFLKSRMVNGMDDKDTLFQRPDLRNVSIITAWNAYKDSYNTIGSERFASDTGQRLTSFRSVDLLTAKVDPKETSGKRQKEGG